MKYKVLAGPLQIDATTQAQTGDIVELSEADGTQLARWGIVEPVAEPEPVPTPEAPSATTATAAKATTTTTDPDTTATAPKTTTTAK